MRTFSKLATIFSRLPTREKLFVVVLSVVFLTSLTQYFVLRDRLNVKDSDDYFIEGMVGNIHYLNPIFADYNDADRDVDELIFSGLIRYDPIAKNFFPDLAESIDRSSDDKKITITLRPNITWHDGTPLTVDDVLYTYRDIIQSPGFKNPVLRSAFDGVQIEASGTSKIIFTLPRPNSYFISELTVGILPKHILGDTSVSDFEKSPFNKNPIGTGPYKVVQTKLASSGDSISLKEYENYYGEHPTIQNLKIVTFANESGLIAEIDALDSISKIHPDSDIAKKAEESQKFNVSSYHLNQFTALYLNSDNQFLGDKKIRKAISLSINKNELTNSTQNRIDTILFENKANDERFMYDTTKADTLFSEAGYNKNDQGNRYSSKGERVILPLVSLDKVGTELPTLIAAQLAQEGIEVPIRIVSEEEFTNLVNSREYSLLLMRQGLGYNRDVYPLFHSSQAQDLSQQDNASTDNASGTDQTQDTNTNNGTPGLNFANFRSFRTDGLTEAIRKADVPQDKDKLLAELSEILADENAVIFISTPQYLYAINKSIAPFPVSALDFHSDRFTVLTNLARQQAK